MKFIFITALMLGTQMSHAANIFCELGISKKDGSEKKVLKTETIFVNDDVTDENSTTYIDLDGGDITGQVIYFANHATIRMESNRKIATQWVVTLEISSKTNLDVMDLKTEILAPGSEPLTVFDQKHDGSGGFFASCQMTP